MGIIRRKKRFGNYTGAREYRRPLVFSGNKISSKEKTPIKIKWKYVFFVVLTLSLTYLFFFSDYFMVKDVFIEGNNLVTKEEILTRVPKGSNIFRISVEGLKKQTLENNKEIKSIEVFRGIPNALKVVILEHDNKLIWESGGERFLVSSQGKITRRLSSEERFEYPRVIDSKNINVKLGDEIVSPSFVSFALNINNHFFEVTNIKPSYFQVPETTFDLHLYTEEGFYVKLNTLRSSAKQLDNLKKVLVAKRGSIKEYVDLRIDGLAYYK